MGKIILTKIKESVLSVLPISALIFLLCWIFVPNCSYTLLCFAICSILLMVGICLFNTGCDVSLMKMGEYIGAKQGEKHKLLLYFLCTLIIGIIVSVAEPDLTILASQVPNLNKWIFILAVAGGVGIFLTLNCLRVFFKIKLSRILAVSYILVFILCFFVPKQFLPICFDASGVTTGPISVPFIIAFGLGVASVNNNNDKNESFGLLALCSVGPIFSIMIISTLLGNNTGLANTSVVTYNSLASFSEIWLSLKTQILNNLKEVAIILLPIVLFFIVYQTVYIRLPKRTMLKLIIGVIYVYVGISLFFTGVNSGYLLVAHLLPANIISSGYAWLLIPICLLFGLTIALAEPAVLILNKKVEEISSGTISRKLMMSLMAVGIALSVVLSVVRILLKINILYFYIPILAIEIILIFFIPEYITAIAFDSGGVASGALSSSFILPFMHGLCLSKGIDLMPFGFGSIGLIILTPILIVELMGVIIAKQERIKSLLDAEDTIKKVKIIEFD